MSSLIMGRAADRFVRGNKFADRLAEIKKELVGRKITDVIWEEYHGDEIAAMLVLDNGGTIRGPVIAEYDGIGKFD